MTLFAGRYALLQKLASGGMAEVFLARQQGVGGFEKLVVLKRILPTHTDNPDFVRMFLDEARTAADLGHPNVVNVFDAGLADGTYFIAMEYLRGKDLGAVFQELVRRGRRLPLGVSLHLLAEAARGLHAAHTKKDLEGRALAIVHRDISPQNLFLTWDGVTKVLDFGIARAAFSRDSTEAGVLKGKIAYLSPEQLDGAPLDGRSDQFSLGIVAWELLTGKRLFQRPSEAETLRAILDVKVPRPAAHAPEVPAEVEEVVLRMLSGRREQRFPDCAATAGALEAWLDSTRTLHSPTRVAEAMRELFAEPAAAPGDATARLAAEAPGPTQPGVPAPVASLRDVTTRSERRRKPLPMEADFLGAVSDHLQRSKGPRRTNLVPPSGPFVGREPDLAALGGLVGAAGLTTVVGFGGLGKTRLAVELAWREREAWAAGGGVWLVNLAAARTAEDVSRAVAHALEVAAPVDAGREDSATQAGRTLRSLGRALVILDNFEQVVAAGEGTVGRWLRQAPQVSFLVTSREALGLPGERVHQLAPLGTSGGASSEAVRLFLARAQLAGRSPTAAELGTVAAICRRLEGHALAIELAAAQLPQLAPAELLERLEHSFTVLGGAEPARGRQGTLWNTIEWSWQLLSPQEQAVLAQLSVFRGGFTPESGAAVVDLTRFPLAPPRLEVIVSLHRKSLLQHFVAPEAPQALRLKMLEAVQEFAGLKLAASEAEQAQVRARHAAHFLGLGQACLQRLDTVESEAAMGELFAEHQNLTLVFERALHTLPPTPESASTALQALQVLEPVMQRQGPHATHAALLDDALRVAEGVGVDAATLAIGFQQRGNAWRVRGRLARAVQDLDHALTLARTTGDRALLARVGTGLAVARFVSGQLDAAVAGLEEALALARAAGDVGALVQALAYLAIVRAARAEPAEAIAHCDEALPLARERGDRLDEARLLGTMGGIFQDQGRLDLAAAFLREAVERCRAIREVRLQGYFQGKLAHVLLERGDLAGARRRLTEALGLLVEVGDLRHEGLFLGYLASLEAAEGRTDAARVGVGSARLRLESVEDALLLTALALRAMEVEVRAAGASHAEARALLAEARAPRGPRPAAVHQSEEVRLSARWLERALRVP